MSVYEQNKEFQANRIFISYSSIDRVRTSGLALLLEAMGHQVFHDHRTIKPGMAWQSALQDGLDDATAVMVFWTKHASRSDWVRKEYEYFTAKYPDRVLIPVLGDDTPLTELLKTRQQADFVPVVNEVLEKKRQMKKEGAGAREIERAVTARLEEEGVKIDSKKNRRLLFMFLGFGWLATLLRFPWAWLGKTGNGAVEATAQASASQVVVLAAAAAVGIGAYPTAKRVVEQGLPEDVQELRTENANLQDEIDNLSSENAALLAANRDLSGVQGAINDLGRQVTALQATGPAPSCISPDAFAGCRDGIQTAQLDLTRRLDALSGNLALIASGNETPVVDVVDGTEIVESGLLEIDDCDTAPQPEYQPEPAYPVMARENGIEGVVMVSATINPDGSVSGISTESDSDVLGDAAKDAVREWKFSECIIGDAAVAAAFTVKISFSLRN